jgi:hypothetical protein
MFNSIVLIAVTVDCGAGALEGATEEVVFLAI